MVTAYTVSLGLNYGNQNPGNIWFLHCASASLNRGTAPWSLLHIQVMNTIGNCPLRGSEVLLFACSVSSDENKPLEGLKRGENELELAELEREGRAESCLLCAEQTSMPLSKSCLTLSALAVVCWRSSL